MADRPQVSEDDMRIAESGGGKTHVYMKPYDDLYGAVFIHAVCGRLVSRNNHGAAFRLDSITCKNCKKVCADA